MRLILILLIFFSYGFDCSSEHWEINYDTHEPNKVIKQYKIKRFSYRFDAERYANMKKIPLDNILTVKDGQTNKIYAYDVYSELPGLTQCVYMTNGGN